MDSTDKKYAIARIAIASVAALILLGLLIGVLNGRFNIPFGFNISGGYFDDSLYTSGAGEKFAEDAAGVDRLVIYWTAGDIKIDGDGEKFTFYEDKNYDDENKRLIWKRDGDTLYIRYCRSKSENLFSMANFPSKTLFITLPSGGEAMIKDLEINTVSAKTEITAGIFDDVKINTVSGETDMTCEAEKISFDGVSGNLTVNAAGCPSIISADTVSGNIYIKLGRDRSFVAHTDTVSGEIISNIETAAEKGGTLRHTYGGGEEPAVFDFNTVSGNVNIGGLWIN